MVPKYLYLQKEKLTKVSLKNAENREKLSYEEIWNGLVETSFVSSFTPVQSFSFLAQIIINKKLVKSLKLFFKF